MTVNQYILKGSFRNIMRVWQRTPENVKREGAVWYPIARQIGRDIDHSFGLRENSGAGILAALSPSMEWGNNITEAYNLVRYGKSKRQSGINNDKAKAIRDGAEPLTILGGKKVRNFYRCIVDAPNKNAVIDRHAVSIYMGRHISDREIKGLQRVRVYERIAGAYENVARMVGEKVETVQAATWVQWRIEKGIA